MNEMKILLTGGSGLFGEAFYNYIKKTGHIIYATYHQHYCSDSNYVPLDITDKREVHRLVSKLGPNIIVHAAAYTDVDACEKHRQKAFDINVKGTENIAKSAQKIEAKCIYISTDYVFDGGKGMYNEGSETRPINYYGKTKLRGEQVVKDICENFVIARTSVLFGREKHNFVTWAVNRLRSEQPISIVTDQWVSPTLNTDLAEQIHALIEKKKRGIFHTAGRNRLSRFELTHKLAEIFGFDTSLVLSTTMAQMDWAAKRPKDSSLDTSKITNTKRPLGIDESLARLKEELQ